ncbi:Hypothetical protein GbCGDNIH9_8730 [Granulibacter bethesdensis]|uniref:Uncharacterized protein n=1 Tax=Granulibacter bethesdensis TaxID=364410 RepID=A0AAC9KBZ9_9PROT|nr:Hypothetical protein GbCGDNIH9_8730 [Granulibacter bethesdensis]APH62766.1 Hypothetical protein GbCGDNIH8_8730 [Granulibacter bethesdensis]
MTATRIGGKTPLLGKEDIDEEHHVHHPPLFLHCRSVLPSADSDRPR